MNRRSFIKGCFGGAAGLVLGGSLPAMIAKQGGVVGKDKACLLVAGEVGVRYSWPRQMVAGEDLRAGERIVVGSDGKSYGAIGRQQRCIKTAMSFQVNHA